MKVFVSSDMEGTAGIVDWEQVRPGSPAYPASVELLLAEVNAAIEGAVEAGATEVLVNDSHGRMANLPPARLAGRARYLSGRYKPLYMMQGLDASFDAAMFVSYHGSMSARASTLSHTYYPAAFAEVTLNKAVVGEAGINCLVAQAHNVAVVLVTGDDTTAAEIHSVSPGTRAAVVKHSVSRFAADSLHPADACELIRTEAHAALSELGAARPPAIDLPATLGIRCHTSDYAELAARVAGVSRTGDVSVEIAGADPGGLYATFITVVLLCRGLVD